MTQKALLPVVSQPVKQTRCAHQPGDAAHLCLIPLKTDRKSTRLNSSH
jgi:hypothetical protein